MGEEFFRQIARRFERDYAHSFVGLGVEQGRGEFTEIAMLERPSAQPAPRDRVDSVSRATIDLDKNDQTFAGLRLFYPDQAASEHRHPDAQRLPGTHMAMILFGLGEIFGQGVHQKIQDWDLPSYKSPSRQ